MTQRNPMNERYTTDDGRKGVTRKSAASAKPATKAAASVYIEPKKKPQKKGFFARLAGGQKNEPQTDAQRKKQEEQRATAAAYYNPPTPEYRRLRRIWWALLIVAIAFTALSFWLNSSGIQGPLPIVVLVIAYGSIIAALWLELSKIKKVRQRYQAEMEHSKTKAAKRERKERMAAIEAEREEAERKAAEKKAKRANGLFGRKKKDDAEADAEGEASQK